ncbi:MAG: hypothetical protein ABJA74_05675 [Lapillicoccus sp.]
MELPLGLTTRSLHPDDAERVFELSVASETYDAGHAALDLEDIVSEWQTPGFDLPVQAVGVDDDDDDALVGYAAVEPSRSRAAPARTRRRR